MDLFNFNSSYILSGIRLWDLLMSLGWKFTNIQKMCNNWNKHVLSLYICVHHEVPYDSSTQTQQFVHYKQLVQFSNSKLISINLLFGPWMVMFNSKCIYWQQKCIFFHYFTQFRSYRSNLLVYSIHFAIFSKNPIDHKIKEYNILRSGILVNVWLPTPASSASGAKWVEASQHPQLRCVSQWFGMEV